MSIKPPAPTYLGPAANSGPGTNKPIDRVVIHATVSPCVRGGARTIARYFHTTSRDASAHYVVDPSEVVQVVGDSVVAYHAPPNQHSLGIELCDPMRGPDSRWSDVDHEAMLKRAAELTAQLCLAYKVPILKVSGKQLRNGGKGICGHVDVRDAWHQTDHYDPGTGFPWKHFMQLVRTAAADLLDKAAPKKPQEHPNADEIVRRASRGVRASRGRRRSVFARIRDLAKTITTKKG